MPDARACVVKYGSSKEHHGLRVRGKRKWTRLCEFESDFGGGSPVRAGEGGSWKNWRAEGRIPLQHR